ncbi:MAG TPA: T9SS type A sorting domain-containing protein, partial [Flavobacteriaceae bacterium]|nr:T9SS type A sorting domain-containing protein [Flavobacteriaceae bacterium]
FALFKDDAFVYNGRIDIVEANSGGDYTVGIATSNSTADAIWATDLTFGTTYRATVRYNQDSNIAQLWIDATSSSDTSIMGADETDPGTTITQFGFRQSSSSSGESILVDNLVIASTFNGTLSSKDYSIIDGLEIYPNPTTLGYINIFSKSQSAMKVGVFDILGKQVMSRTVENNRLDVSTLTSGLYIMKISQDNATATKKLVVK